jgi:hypothetical protein
MTFNTILWSPEGADYAVSKNNMDYEIGSSTVTPFTRVQGRASERSAGSLALGREMLRGVDTERSECAQHDSAVTHANA